MALLVVAVVVGRHEMLGVARRHETHAPDQQAQEGENGEKASLHGIYSCMAPAQSGLVDVHQFLPLLPCRGIADRRDNGTRHGVPL